MPNSGRTSDSVGKGSRLQSVRTFSGDGMPLANDWTPHKFGRDESACRQRSLGDWGHVAGLNRQYAHNKRSWGRSPRHEEGQHVPFLVERARGRRGFDNSRIYHVKTQ